MNMKATIIALAGLLGVAPQVSAQTLEQARADRTTAMQYAERGDCAKTVASEEKVIAYWKTRESAEPQNAFFQQGEMANEAARICFDLGKFDEAEKWYRKGSKFGKMEPEPRTHSESLWDFRLAHALARIAARKGDKAEAQTQIAKARAALDRDTAVARAQERYFPYLVGYVALYTGDLKTAQAELDKAAKVNERDPFMRYLLGLTHEKMGHADVAKSYYDQALELATANNPPSIFVRRTLAAVKK